MEEQIPKSPLVMTSRPQDVEEELWFMLRDQRVIIADRGSISFDSIKLTIDGTLRKLTVPLADVRTLRYAPLQQEFRNAGLATLFLSAAFLFSPQGLPGYYPGRIGNAQDQFPGLTFPSVLFSTSASIAVGFLAQNLRRNDPPIPVEGLSPTAWSLLLEERRPRWHFSGVVAYVHSYAKQRWMEHHQQYGFSEQKTAPPYSSPRPEMSDINLGRFLSLAYAIEPSFLLGLAYQNDGVMRFYETVSYIRPGNPPQEFIQETYSQAASSTLYITGQHNFHPFETRRASVSLGAGVGRSSIDVRVRGFDARASEVLLVEDYTLSLIGTFALNYHFDRECALGLHLDYTSNGKIMIPEIGVVDSGGRVNRIVNAFRLPMESLGVGLRLGLSF